MTIPKSSILVQSESQFLNETNLATCPFVGNVLNTNCSLKLKHAPAKDPSILNPAKSSVFTYSVGPCNTVNDQFVTTVFFAEIKVVVIGNE